MANQDLINSYLYPYYARLQAMNGKTACEFSQAAFLAFIAQFPDYPINTRNVEFLKNCFEQHFNQVYSPGF